MHRGHERDERDKQRAKDEVNRLNGVVSGNLKPGISGEGGAPWRRKLAIAPANNELRQATPADRKRQLAQLAEMGVAIPEEFRREMAMAGDWQYLTERPVSETLKTENGSEDHKNDGLNVGVRKRKYEGQEEEEQAGEIIARKGWGSTTRTYPDTAKLDDDLDFLLGNNPLRGRIGEESNSRFDRKENVLQESAVGEDHMNERISQPKSDAPLIKSEDLEVDENPQVKVYNLGPPDDSDIKREGISSEPGIMFKKRKAKPMRNK